MGLGPLNTITLEEARAFAVEARKVKLAGFDPIDARRSERDAKSLDSATSLSTA